MKKRPILQSLVSPMMILILWEVVVRGGLVNPVFLPSPSSIFRELVAMIASWELFYHLEYSLFRIIVGFLIGAVVGVIVGVLMGWYRWCEQFFDPLISATYPIPKIAILPLILLWLGFGELSKVAIVAISSFYQVAISTFAGVRSVDPILVRAAVDCSASELQILLKVILPGALPSVFTGLRLGLGVSLIVVVAAEFVAAKFGIGYLIWSSAQIFQTERMMAGIIVTSALGFGLTFLLKLIERAAIPWRQAIKEEKTS